MFTAVDPGSWALHVCIRTRVSLHVLWKCVCRFFIYIFTYVCDFDKERERNGESERHLWMLPRGNGVSRLVLYQVLRALMPLLLSSLIPTAKPSDAAGDRQRQITHIANATGSSKKIMWNLWCSLCCVSSALEQKAVMTSELAEASPSCRRTFLSAVVWVSLTERPICCHFCLYAQCPLKQMVLHNKVWWLDFAPNTMQHFIPTIAVAFHIYDRLQRKYLN